jgi:RND superfamily putative drug exporter
MASRTGALGAPARQSFLYRVGGAAARHPWRVIAGWVCALAVIVGVSGAFGGALNDDYTIPGSESQQAYDLLQERFPERAGADARVVVHADNGLVDLVELDGAVRRLKQLSSVGVVSPPMMSQDGATALVPVQYDVLVTELDGEEAVAALEQATDELRDDHLVAFGGQVPENLRPPSGKAEMIGILAALAILLLAFGSVVSAGVPVGVALVGLGIGSGLITFMAAITDVSTASPTLGSMIGIGLGVDYALFILTRHRDALTRGLSVPEAAAEANATAGMSVVFAGGTVLLALSGLQFTGVPNFKSMGYAAGIVALVTVLAAVTLVPALLGLAGMRVYSRRARRTGRLQSASHSPSAVRLAQAVARRPVVWMTASAVLLLALAAPALGMKLGASDAGNESKDTTTRQAYDLIADAFGPGSNAPLLLAVDLQQLERGALPDLQQDVASTTGVASVSPAAVSNDGSAAVLTVIPTTGPQDEETLALLDELRRTVPQGVHIGGFTATMDDFTGILAENLWLVVAVVLATSFLLMVVAFRSIVVPLKAVAVNLLSVGAAYGVLVLAFQTTTGADLLGLPGTVPIAAFVPVLMFAILFGLSMDYEVFLLSRVREEYLRTGDNTASVVTGLSATARVISSAALIMVTVFLGFALDPAVIIKMMGIGLATAIAVDATVVRLVLVPATMALLGERNWYLPRWLDRILPDIGLHGSSPLEASILPAQRPGQPRELVSAGISRMPAPH